jgi:hypothetical protein
MKPGLACRLDPLLLRHAEDQAAQESFIGIDWTGPGTDTRGLRQNIPLLSSYFSGGGS